MRGGMCRTSSSCLAHACSRVVGLFVPSHPRTDPGSPVPLRPQLTQLTSSPGSGRSGRTQCQGRVNPEAETKMGSEFLRSFDWWNWSGAAVGARTISRVACTTRHCCQSSDRTKDTERGAVGEEAAFPSSRTLALLFRQAHANVHVDGMPDAEECGEEERENTGSVPRECSSASLTDRVECSPIPGQCDGSEVMVRSIRMPKRVRMRVACACGYANNTNAWPVR